MAVNFYIDNRTDKHGNSPIRVSITIRGSRFLTSTSYKIQPNKWDAKKQQAKKGCFNSWGMSFSVINLGLSKITEHFALLESECIVSNKRLRTEELKAEYQKIFGRNTDVVLAQIERKTQISDCLDEFIREQSRAKQWADGTAQNFRVLASVLKKYNNQLKFSDLNERGVTEFCDFLFQQKYKSTYIKDLFCRFMWFWRWATKKGYVSANHTISLPKIKQIKSKVVFLEWDELMRINNYEIPPLGDMVNLTTYDGKPYQKTMTDKQSLNFVKDVFCFCCFTSLRFSDAINLKKSDVENGKITITTKKTNATITIELNKYASAIIDKYQSRTDNYVFPYVPNNRMNLDIKFICELCGINKPITQTFYQGNERVEIVKPKFELIGTHTGRRTFICNALMLGIPAEVVMKWTGHADYKAMKPYIDIANTTKERAMKLFDKL